MKLAAAAIASEHRSRDLQRHGGHNPDLPVGKETMDREFPGHAYIRRQAPEAQYISHESDGNEKCTKCQSQAAVFTRRFPQTLAMPEVNTNDHKMNRTRLESNRCPEVRVTAGIRPRVPKPSNGVIH